MGRTENVLVFQDTEQLCKTNQILIDATRTAIIEQKVILETDVLPDIVLEKYESDASL